MHQPSLNLIFDLLPWQKKLLTVISDSLITIFALWIAFALYFNTLQPDITNQTALFISLPLISIFVYFQLGLYQSIIRHIRTQAIFPIIKAVLLSTTITVLLLLTLDLSQSTPKSIYIIYFILAILGISSSRYLIKYYYSYMQNYSNRINVAIFGAGNSGIQLADALATSTKYRPKLFIDERSPLQNKWIGGLKVLPTNAIKQAINSYNIQEILLAIPSAEKKRRQEIIQLLSQYPIHVKTVPSINDMLLGRSRIDQIKELEVNELLNRDPVLPNKTLMSRCISHRAIMVTGAGGSIGSELCRQILTMQPSCLVLYELTEYALYRIEQELLKQLSNQSFTIELVAILGNVCDQSHMTRIMRDYQVKTLYHAAAYKHVPLVESNPIEGIKNNILGTYHAAQAAIATNVEHFVLISTDKAVNPTNVMGATKRLSEMILQGLNQLPNQTCFSMVRFGNVLGSSGSVIPLFRKQISEGGPITLTHKEVTRFFMTIPEASQLVIQAGAMGTGGDVFILEMGDSILIQDLAERMVYLSGLTLKTEKNPHGDIALSFIGLRNGEKLYEELSINSQIQATEHSQILRATEQCPSWNTMEKIIAELNTACAQNDLVSLLNLLVEHVNGYQCQHPAYNGNKIA